ncbi:MAG: cytochrome c oxidase subunit 3 [Acidobacteria bacterium]|nr:cytochrome c oxidase subunit 3 [Acidobacteriota bacterium]
MSHSASSTFDRWSGGTCPFDAGWRKVMMWWFIVTDGLLFAGFLAAYGYARLLAFHWPDQAEVFSLKYIAAMTFVLISSSATMATAVDAARKGARSTALRFILLTAAGGAIFLGMQAYEWSHLIAEGARLNANPWGDAAFGAYFFLLTGFHGTHVLTGVIILATTAIRTAMGRTQAEGVEMAGLYWHFVDLVWVFIFTLFYLL